MSCVLVEGERRVPARVHARPDALRELDGADLWLAGAALNGRDVGADEIERVE